MRFDAPERAAQVEAVARRFAGEVLAPRAASLDVTHEFPRDSLAQAAAAGLLAVNVPAALGGLEAGVLAYSRAVVQCAQACASTTVAMCVSNMVAEVVTAFGTTAQRELHVPRLSRGEYVVGGFALSEPGAGSDPGGMRTRAVQGDDGWTISGSKLWITSGTDAGLFVVWAKTSDAPGARGITAFLVPGDAPGLSAGKPEHKMGLRGSTTTSLQLDEVKVPHDAVLGEVGGGFKVAMMALDGGRIGIASQALGIGRAALREALAAVADGGEEVGTGTALGPLATQQGVQWPLASCATELDAGELLVQRAAWLKQAGRPFSAEASMAKAFCSEHAHRACEVALSIVPLTSPRYAAVERMLRDVRVTMIYEGTSEIQRVVIARELVRGLERARA